MRESFDAALKHVLVHEGGYVDHPRDPGGATNKGITLATYRSWLGRSVTKQELRAIPDSTVASIYRARYWGAVKGDDLPAGLDYAVFDFGVNSGPKTAVKRLQAVIGTDADGIVGPETLAAINRHGVPNTITDLCAARMAFLRSLKTWGTFGKGWKRRVEEVERVALEMRPRGRPAPEPEPPPFIPPEVVNETNAEPAHRGGFFAWLLDFLFGWLRGRRAGKK